ncbi:HNH endonuclease [Vibrio vulnificus]|nr:HNH endonuclease [Vibrio vulnificus]
MATEKKTRVKIPEELAAKVQFDSDRTCCVCRTENQRIQIHHIDENPSHNQYENLAVLCFQCHWETQIRGGFDRKLNAAQVKLYRDDWLEIVKRNREQGNEKRKDDGQGTIKDYIEYEVVQDSIVSYSNSDVLKNSGAFVLWALLSLILAVSVFFVSFSFQEPLIMAFLAPIMLVSGIKLTRLRPFIDMLFMPQNDEIDTFLAGKYVHKGSDGNYTVFTKESMCNQPNCDGIVSIKCAPPRERHKHGVIGRCNRDPNLHTFTVDYSGTGRFKEMDFRPIPVERK